MPNIVFMGTPDFAVPALEQLHREFGIAAVVTVPDKQSGRGLHLKPSAVSLAADALHIQTVLKPESLKAADFVEQMRALQPDIICVIAFRILPASVYSTARIGAFNVHASLLPKYRGAAPINWAIIDGESETGVTSFLLNDVVDTGTILLQKHTPIAEQTTAGELYDSLKNLAADCAAETCAVLLAGTITPEVQNNAVATAAPKVFRETSAIEWDRPATSVRNFIHGLSPIPCAWTTLNGEIVKVFRAETVPNTLSAQISGTFRIVDSKLLVSCNDGELSLLELQLPGKRRMLVDDFLKGYRGPSEGRFA